MQEVILFYNGLEIPTRQIIDSRGAIPSKTAEDTKVAIQEMAEYSQKWHNRTSKSRSTKTFDGLAAIQAQLNNLGREIKAKESMEDTLTKFMSELAKRHEENSNLIKEIQALMDAAIRNQGASIKTLEIQIGQVSKNHTLMYKSRQMMIPFPSRLNGYYYEENKGSYGPQFSEAYSEASQSIPQKEKDPGSFTLLSFINNFYFDNALVDLGANVSVMPLLTYLNLGLGKLAHTKLTIELADRTMKYPKGIAENVLVRIGKFVFLVDFIILDMPEDIKVPLILKRPFLSTTHAKIDIQKKKITLRVGEEKVVYTSVKPASSLIKRVYMLSLRERMELDLEARLMGETLLRRNQGDDLMPTIDEGEVIEEFRTRNEDLDTGIDDYPSSSTMIPLPLSFEGIGIIVVVTSLGSCITTHFALGLILLATNVVMSSDSHATITYTSMSSYEVIVNGYFGMPMDPLDPYIQLVMEAPPSPDYIPGLEYPEYLPPADDMLPAEEQPLPAAVSPTAESSGYITESEPEMEPEEDDGDDEKSEGDYIKYPTSRGDEDADDDGDNLSEDDADDEDEEESSDSEEEEEEHLAPTIPTPALHSSIPASEDSDETEPFEEGETAATPPPFGYHVAARISVQPHILMPFHSESEVEILLAIPTSPLSPVSPTSYPLPLFLIPLPIFTPLPTSSFPLPLSLPSTSGSESIPEADIPLRKRACFTTPTGGYEIGESSIVAAARHIRHALTIADSRRAEDRLIGRLRRERRYFRTLSTTYVKEVAHSYGYCTQIMDYCQSRKVHTSTLVSQIEALQRDVSTLQRQHIDDEERLTRHIQHNHAQRDVAPEDVSRILFSCDFKKMAPKRARTTRANPDPTRTTTATEPMTQEAIDNLIAQRVAEALAEYETHRNSVVNRDTSNTTRTGPRTVRPTRECTYKDYLNCGPLKFNDTEGVIGLTRWFERTESVSSISNCTAENQVKFAFCTLIGSTLTWWNSHMRAVSQEVAYTMPWRTLKQKMTAKYCPRTNCKRTGHIARDCRSRAANTCGSKCMPSSINFQL
nr:hypothetical protein [Tanacetum cinerariifolium]